MPLLTARLLRVVLLGCLALTNGAWAPPAVPTPVGPTPESPETPRHLQIGPPPQGSAALSIQPETAAPAAVAAYSPYSRVAFQAVSGDNWDIFTANDDGTGLVGLSSNQPSNDIHPRLTRGADRIAFASDRTGNYEIFSANADGGSLAQLTGDGSDDVSPYWSPDGSRIAFQAYRDGQPEVYVMNANGSGQTRLTDNPDYDGQPTWSPDGTKIAFTTYRNGQWRIWVMDANGSNQTQLSQQPYSEDPVWSPDGTRIAYDSDSDQNGWTELWVMNADGGAATQLVAYASQTDVYAGGWSPDGQRIALNRVQFVESDGSWFWTHAYVCYAAPYPTSYDQGCLNVTDTEWRPDWQTTDAASPATSMVPLPAASPINFTISWSGTDTGSGIHGYDIQFRHSPSEAWQDLYNDVGITSYDIQGQVGVVYYFRVRGRDNAGNVEAWPANFDATTTIETLPPVTSVGGLPLYSSQPFTVTWSGTDPGGSGIDHYDVQYYDNVGQSWNDWLNTTYESGVFGGTPGLTYSFRSRGIDRAGNIEAWPASSDAHTTPYDWSLDLTARDNRGTPIGGAALGLVPSALFSAPSDTDGRYTAYAALNGVPVTYTASWSKAGYGPLPNGQVRTSDDGPQEVILPPADNLVANGGFETGGLGAWLAGGSAPPIVTSALRHTGGYAVLEGTPDAQAAGLESPNTGQGTVVATQTVTSQLMQPLTIPLTMTAPTLSFMYLAGGLTAGRPFSVAVDSGSGPTIVFSSTAQTANWTHAWADLSAWSGQTVTVTFGIATAAGQPTTFAYIDEVSLGAAHPDTWVTIDGTPTGVAGDLVQYTLHYGNRGAVTASGLALSLQLDPHLQFVSATDGGNAVGQTVSWTTGSLPPGSDSGVVTVTARVLTGSALLSFLNSTAQLSAPVAELETGNNQAAVATQILRRLFMAIVVR